MPLNLSDDIVCHVVLPYLVRIPSPESQETEIYLKDLYNFMKMSKKYMRLSDQNEELWKEIAQAYQLKTLNKKEPGRLQIGKFIQFKKDSSFLYSYIASIIGVDAFNALPVLDIGNRRGRTDYIDFIKCEDVSAPIMKGHDIWKRPFITLRYIDRLYGDTKVLTIFHRYTDSNTITTGSCYRGDCMPDRILTKECEDYLVRLLCHEPCGILSMNPYTREDEDNVRLTSNKESIIELI